MADRDQAVINHGHAHNEPGKEALAIQLSAEQEAIVRDPTFGNKLILSVAGSGKTTVMIARILYMVTHMACDPSEFFVVTFTKNASVSILHRLNQAREGIAQQLRCGTFHALARRVLRQYRVLSADAVWNVDELQYHFLEFLRTDPRAAQFKEQIKHVFVDEYQDVNQVQYDILVELNRERREQQERKQASQCVNGALNHANTNNPDGGARSSDSPMLAELVTEYAHDPSNGPSSTTVIGDDNQNIYSFRGSSIRFIQEFAKNFRQVRTFYLSTNYRSSPQVVRLANAAIAGNRDQIAKPPSQSAFAHEGPRKPVLINTSNTFQSIAKMCDDIALLLRVDALARPPKQPTLEAGDICILCRSSYLLFHAQSLLMQRGVRSLFLSGDDCYSRSRETLLHHCRDRVVLSTIHAAKGLEWQHVYIIGLHERFFPDWREADIDRERRLWYVAITRCKTHLTVCNAFPEPSLFVVELVARLRELFITDTVRFPRSVDVAPLRAAAAAKRLNMPVGVTQAIRALNGEHYIDLKKRLLPANLEQLFADAVAPAVKNEDNANADDVDSGDDDEQTHASSDFQHFPFVTDNFIEAEFGTFLDCLCRRMIADIVHQRLHGRLAGSPTQSEEMDHWDDALFLDKHAAKCLESLLDEREYQRQQKQQGGVGVPVAKRAQLAEAYRQFRDKQKTWRDLLEEIYCVSLCSSIAMGHTAILYVPVKRQDLMLYAPMYDAMERHLQQLLADCKFPRDLVATAASVQYHNECNGQKLMGEIDLCLRDTVIDFKNSLFEPEQCRLEHFLQVLTYASILQCSQNKRIRYVGVYNIIANRVFRIDITGWHQHQALCDMLLRVSAERDLVCSL